MSPRPDRGDRRDGPQAWREISGLARTRWFRGDPSRLTTAAGERIIDIYRAAYAAGGLTAGQARAVHSVWMRDCLVSVPSIVMIAMPCVLLLALSLSGVVAAPRAVWAAAIYSAAGNVALSFAWYATAAAWLHARGVPLIYRTLGGLATVTLLLALGHEILHRFWPGTFVELGIFITLLLPFQMMVFWVCHVGFDIHIDYPRVTARWTDTPLQRLLPFDKRGKLVFLRASDHYVIVRTTKGEHELRMRFADALDRLGTARGLQVHRSFWVAQEYLAAPRKDGRRMVMRVDGVTIPISATYREDVMRHLDLSSQE